MCEFFQKGFGLNFYLEKKTFVFNHVLLNIEKYLNNVYDKKKYFYRLFIRSIPKIFISKKFS